jgi:Mg-chelatase subunit ChlD
MSGSNIDYDQFPPSDERRRRWRLVLGDPDSRDSSDFARSEASSGSYDEPPQLSSSDQEIDDALDSVYGESRGGDLSDSSPDIARRLGDIRAYFPESIARVIIRDMVERLTTRQLVQIPDLLVEVEPDTQLAAALLSLRKIMPARTQETARLVVAQVVRDLMQRLDFPLRQAITGSLNRAARTTRPRNAAEVNWQRTIYTNLRHYQPQQQTIVPESLVGFGRRRATLQHVILCVDTSGSMAPSVVYASIAAAVLASIPALATRLVLFDTNVVDLSDQIGDPVDLLFGIRLGGGTNIGRALTYCQSAISRPRDTILILITDLFEGGDKPQMLRLARNLVEDGVRLITLLALSDQGTPRYDINMAQQLAGLGVPCFACTPDQLPELMAAALARKDLSRFTEH